MASNKFSLIDVQNDDQEIDLQFQDFGSTSTDTNKNKDEQTIYFSEFPDSAADDAEQRLLDEDQTAPQRSSYSFWSFEYYQQYFDVESKQVGDRIVWSALPKPGVNYLQSYIRPNPDLYGPFWVCITLVLTTAISGNVAEYLQTPLSYHWKYDFHKVTLAASMICSYAWLVPIMIWGVLLWRGSKASLTLLELICIYGYSLSVFVPVSILWTIPLPWLQWCLGIVATVLSGSVLIRTILPAVSHEAKKIAIASAVVILILHAALALGFMLYFFYSPPMKSTISPDSNHNLTIAQPQAIPNKPDIKIDTNKSDGSKIQERSNETPVPPNNTSSPNAKMKSNQVLQQKLDKREEKDSKLNLTQSKTEPEIQNPPTSLSSSNSDKSLILSSDKKLE